ncbi:MULTISPECIES: hypothetical protein [unclassified Polynucleobacter]|nr:MULTISPECIES: hypothetical protein [unclassified Polynucleobacter]
MLVAFQVRSLLERPKVNDQVRSSSMSVLRYKKISDHPFTVMGSGCLHERFNMEHPEPITLSALEICNQLIHYYWMQTLSEGRAFVSMLVFSDYQRHKWAYQMQIEDLLELFYMFGNDSSAIKGIKLQWDEKKQDYFVTSS